jgi:hypothetical protein
MGIHPNDGRHVASRLIYLYGSLCLLALLPYFILSLTYYVHLTLLSPAVSSPAPRAGPTVAARQAEIPPFPHDLGTCPICQAASSCQDYGKFSFHQVPDCASPARLTAFTYPFQSIAIWGLWVSGPVPHHFTCIFSILHLVGYLKALTGRTAELRVGSGKN